jgi:hypothetical protein
MIRHVSIRAEDEVIAGAPCFAWFDTIADEFCTFSGNQVWATWDDFSKDWRDEPMRKDPLVRFLNLFPEPSNQEPGAQRRE